MGKVKIKPYQVIEGNLMAVKDTRDFGGSNMWHLHIATKGNYWESVQWMDVRRIQDFFTEKLPLYKEMAEGGVMADGGMMAKGGLTEHGLKIGDEIYDISKNDRNSIYVMNNLLETNKTTYALVDLENGERIEGIYADGGMMAKGGVPRQRKYDNGGMMAKGGYDDFGYHKVNKEVTLKNGEKIYITKGRYYWSNELGDGRVSGIYYESKDGMISKDSIDKMALGGMTDKEKSLIQSRTAKIWDEKYKGSDQETPNFFDRTWKECEEQAIKELKKEKKLMALGGLFGDSRYNYGRSWTLDHRQHNKGQSYEIPLKNRKRKY